MRSCIKGQAMVEFVLFASVLSLILLGIIFFGSFGIKSFYADILARNNALRDKGKTSNQNFRQYVFESAEMVRFVYNYESKLNPGGLSFQTVQGEAYASMDEGPFPWLLKKMKYNSSFTVDRGKAGGRIGDIKHVEFMIGKDLFGTDYMGRLKLHRAHLSFQKRMAAMEGETE